jgi:phosphoglycerol transferase MdoB-like AlkP superfamily enzyme
MTGYVIVMICVLETILLLITKRFSYKLLFWLNYLLAGIFTALLLANTNLYSYWGRHLDAEALVFLKTPEVILLSISWFETFLFSLAFVAITLLSVFIYNWFASQKSIEVKLSFAKASVTALMVLFIGVLMIIPIRGSFGVAPINTGVAYFSQHIYANHAAINPIWNLLYSFKRMDARTHHYKFMDEDVAIDIHQEMTAKSDSCTRILNQDRPNVVVILLEGFSAQVIGSLGGLQATPNFDALTKTGVLFNSIYAASDRSDKGLVATLAGYQVVPAYSIIQYPAKSQSLTFLPKRLREHGYGNMTYLYGGDIGFKGMNSFVTLSGFDQTITIGDFPRSTQGQKWGVHDQYTFDRLLEELKKVPSEPFFKYYFTLSSHEPFDVPMVQVFDDPYVNSVHYTDRCLGQFFDAIKSTKIWDNTLFILIADHGVTGPLKATSQMKERYHIPMLWIGGAMAVTDTIITKLGSQTDMVATLLNQLNISDEGFPFSKNLLDPSTEEFAFFTYPDAFGYISPLSYQVYDNRAKKYVIQEGIISTIDSIRGKAYLQVISADHLKR